MEGQPRYFLEFILFFCQGLIGGSLSISGPVINHPLAVLGSCGAQKVEVVSQRRDMQDKLFLFLVGGVKQVLQICALVCEGGGIIPVLAMERC